MIDFHLFITGGGMDKFIVTDIDPNMGIIVSPGFKKDEIPLLQLVLFYLLTNTKLFSGCSGKINVKNFINLFDEGRAVNPLEG